MARDWLLVRLRPASPHLLLSRSRCWSSVRVSVTLAGRTSCADVSKRAARMNARVVVRGRARNWVRVTRGGCARVDDLIRCLALVVCRVSARRFMIRRWLSCGWWSRRGGSWVSRDTVVEAPRSMQGVGALGLGQSHDPSGMLAVSQDSVLLLFLLVFPLLSCLSASFSSEIDSPSFVSLSRARPRGCCSLQSPHAMESLRCRKRTRSGSAVSRQETHPECRCRRK